MIISLFRKLVAEKQQTLVIVTHDSNVAAAADRVVRMHDGCIVGENINNTAVTAEMPLHAARR
jgi:putative ABC transport system ATP-binding protein